MSEFNNFFTSQFIPHGHCYLWKPGLVGLHILSDGLIALAYYSIPLMLVYFVRLRRDVPFDWIFLMFGAFIVACGTTHVMEIWTLWHPTYWLSGSIKALTAFVSVVTAVQLIPLIPQALALPSPSQLEATNVALQNEISERKQVLEALQQSESTLRSFFDSASMMMGIVEIVNDDVRHISDNAASAKFFGLSPEQTRNQLSSKMGTPKHYIQEWIARYREAERLQAPVKFEYPHNSGDEQKWLRATVCSIPVNSGSPRFAYIIEDVSDRKLAQEQISQLNNELEQRVIERTQQLEAANQLKDELLVREQTARSLVTNILESISDGFYALDNEWRFTYLNSKAEQLLRRSRSQLLGKNIWQEFPEAKDTTFDLEYRRAIAENVSIQFKEFYQPFDIWVEVRAYPSVNGLSVFFQDITQRQQTEAALQQSEMQYRLLIENFPNGAVFLFDRDLRLKIVDGMGLAAVGLSKEGLEGKTILEVSPPEIYQAIEPIYRAALDGFASVEEIPFQEHTYQVHTIPVKNAAGEIIAGMVMTQDITERKRNLELIALQNKVLEAIATGAPLPQVLNTLTKLIEEQSDQGICAIMSLDEDGTKLYPAASASLPESYNQALASGVPVALGMGSCGTAAYTRETVIVSDIASDPLWADFKDAALDHNLQACWSKPIFASNGDVLGTFAMYYNTPRQPSEGDRLIAEVCTYLAGIAIERQQREEALRFSEARLRRVVESGILGILFWDMEGNISEANDAFLNMVGYTQEDLQAGRLHWQDMTPTEHQAVDEKALAELKTTGVCSIFEKEYFRKDGSRVPILLAGATLEGFDDRGVAFVVDISDRKQIEADLQQSNSILQTVLENTTDSIFMKDLQGRYLFINSAGANALKKTIEDIVGKDDTEIFSYDIALPIVENERQLIACGGEQIYEDIVSDTRGELRTFQAVKTVCRNEQGKAIGIVGIARDISDRVAAEEKIRQLNQDLERRVIERTAQLEAANKELEAFSYSLSHDLRTPLRSIDGFSLALMEDYGEQLDDKGKHYLQRVRNASQRMGELIDDLLYLSRVTRSDMHLQTVNLSEMVEAVARDLQQMQSIEFAIAPHIYARGDSKLLKIIFENLLSNAIKFTAKKSSPKIEFGALPQPDGTTVYFVRDNGAGFDMEYATNLFGVFQRLHTTKEFPGTGIGLATVKRIVHRHGGKIWAEAAVEQGATFYFTLEDGAKEL